MASKGLERSYWRAASQTLQETDEMKQRRMAQETAYAGLRSQLGAEGTYDTPTAGTPTAGAESPDLFKQAEKGDVANLNKSLVTTGQIPDAQKIAALNLGSTEGRIASRLTAEAEQLIKREGPLWDEMSKSVTGPIMEGAASFMQEQSETLRRMYARGGAARNRARQGMQEIRVAEQANRARSTQLWNSSLALNQWARDNARTQLQFNEQWASNAPGIRNSFYEQLDNISKFMVESSIPMAMNLTAAGQQASDNRNAEKRAKMQKTLAMGIAAAAVITGGAALAFAPALAGGAGGMAGLMGGLSGGGGIAGGLLRGGISSALQVGFGAQPGSVAQQQMGLFGQIRGPTSPSSIRIS